MAPSLTTVLQRAVDDGTVPGAVALLSRDGQRELVAVGRMAIDGPPMRADAIMQVQSMTKAVTAVAVLRLVEQGRLDLDEPVARWLPELAEPRVLARHDGPLEETVAAARPITVRHLLTCTSGLGIVDPTSPLGAAMQEAGLEAGAEPPPVGADEWLAALADLPLVGQPGEVWRYHHSFAVLGVLLSRVVDRPLGEHLRADVFDPLGMPDTGFWVPRDDLDRLPAAYRHEPGGLVETMPLHGGFYAGPAPFDVSHGELVSTASDYATFAQMLAGGGMGGGRRYLSRGSVAMMTSDQVDAALKTPESFPYGPGFWEGMGWGFGVGVQTSGPHAGRFGWSGGHGSDVWVDPDGTLAVLLTQVEMGPEVMGLFTEVQELG